jgi:hypothetical protein
MEAAKRGELSLPALPREIVDAPELGAGAQVMVGGLKLSERLAIIASLPQRGDSGQDRFLHIPELLALTVVYADGTPVADVQTWEEIGGRELDLVMRLFNVAQRLSGFTVEHEKKS